MNLCRCALLKKATPGGAFTSTIQSLRRMSGSAVHQRSVSAPAGAALLLVCEKNKAPMIAAKKLTRKCP